MKHINLYFNFELTSLSPDGKPISLGIVSDDILADNAGKPCRHPGCARHRSHPCEECGRIEATTYPPKSIYCEFTDYGNAYDDWVKENIIDKLVYKDKPYEGKGNTEHIKDCLRSYLEQFNDYQITFVGDCVANDWIHLLKIIAEWKLKCIRADDEGCTNCIHYKDYICVFSGACPIKIGLPKLPDNITLVPFDINDLITIKKGISVQEAFDIDREELAFGLLPTGEVDIPVELDGSKHNARWDATVIKAIYNKLK